MDEEWVLKKRSEVEDGKEEAFIRGARYVEEELRPEIEQLRDLMQAVAVTRDLVPEHVLQAWCGGVTSQTLRRWGLTPCRKIGSKKFYRMEEVEEFILEEGDAVP